MTDLRGWQLAEAQHLLPDAIVAYVDGELAEAPHHRATAHIRTCLICTAEVGALRQARGALRRAESPAMPASLLASLRSIPQDVELGEQPDTLAVSENGELVTRQRAEKSRFGAGAPLGSDVPLGSDTPLGKGPNVLGRGRFGRRGSQGAGVVVSGLVLGALAFAAPHSPTLSAGPQHTPQRADRVTAAGSTPVAARTVQRNQHRTAAPHR